MCAIPLTHYKNAVQATFDGREMMMNRNLRVIRKNWVPKKSYW